MNKIGIIFGYDGSRYFGSQKQNRDLSVQSEIENFFNTDITLFSRTDRDVSAIGQFGILEFNFDITAEKINYWIKKFNYRFESYIQIKQFFYVNKDIAILSRTYLYILQKQEIFFFTKFKIINPEFDLEKFKKILSEFHGTHNFRKFSTKPSVSTFERTIYSILIEENQDFIKIRITANGFLRKMIRHILGYSFSKAENKKFVLINPNGLFLESVNFDKTDIEIINVK